VTRRKRVVFALMAMSLATFVGAGALFAVDIYLHGRYEKSAGYNVWGYRGPSVGSKRAGEFRIVISGGSAAYGYGANWNEAIPAQLEGMLRGRPGLPPVSVVNLGYNNEGAYSFKYTLEDYEWLNYDLAMLYEGYNDIMNDEAQPNLQVFRHQSPVYRLTGYLPIFPIIFREKAAALLTGGGAGAAYAETRTVFTPGVAARSAAAALNAVSGATDALDRQLERVTSREPKAIKIDQTTGCKSPWQAYCLSVKAAIDFTLSKGKKVLVVGQPHFPKGNTRYTRHLEQQQEVGAMIARMYSGNASVGYVDMGDTVNLSDGSKSFDGMHLTPPGNAIVAAALVEPVSRMIH
jgi:hypothetical protein